MKCDYLILKCRQLDVTHHNIWSRSVEVTEQILHHGDENQDNCSQLSALNLAHNQFTSMPVALPCLAVNLTRLNLSYNRCVILCHIIMYHTHGYHAVFITGVQQLVNWSQVTFMFIANNRILSV
jgi:hypothetical protein